MSRDASAQRHDQSVFGRGPGRGAWAIDADLLAAARRVVHRQAQVLARLVRAGPTWLPPARIFSSACGSKEARRLGLAAGRLLRGRCEDLLRAWENGCHPTEEPSDPGASVREPAEQLLRWAAHQLELLPANAPARVPLLHALVLGAWGMERVPSVDAFSFFQPLPDADLWLAGRLVDEARGLLHERTLYDVAVPLSPLVEDLVWLATGILERPALADFWPASRPRPSPAWPWPDGLDRLRVVLGEGGERPGTGLDPGDPVPIRTLGDLKRMARLREQAEDDLDLTSVKPVPLAELLEHLGQPADRRRAVAQEDVEVLWDFVGQAPRAAYEARLDRAVAAASLRSGYRHEPMLRSGAMEHQPAEPAVLVVFGAEPVLIELAKDMAHCRVRARGQLWPCGVLHAYGSGPGSRVVCGFPELAREGLPSGFELTWPEGGGAPVVYGRSGAGEVRGEVVGWWGV